MQKKYRGQESTNDKKKSNRHYSKHTPSQSLEITNKGIKNKDASKPIKILPHTSLMSSDLSQTLLSFSPTK